MKVQKTYSIEESIYNAFDSLTNERKINKSSFIEDIIKKYLKDNDMDFVDKLYSLKTNPDHIVTVTSQDTTYYYLSDGSKIQKILFMQIFKECEAVNPTEFFNKYTSIFENLGNKIRTIDESKVEDYPKTSHSSFESILNMMDDKYKESVENPILKEIRQEQINKLDDINKRYKSGEFINKSRLEICEVIIHLMQLNFIYGESEYILQHSLIEIFNKLKVSTVQQIPI